MNARKAIIIGASSGIGRALAFVLSENGYTVGLAARRVELLNEIKDQLPGPAFVQRIDVADVDNARAALADLITTLQGVDLVVVNAGVGLHNPAYHWNPERTTIDVNVTGFAAMTHAALTHFIEQGRGHLVGISSVAAIRGGGEVPVYGATKAFEYQYLANLRYKIKAMGLPITITAIRPGFVDTPMVRGQRMFWVASARKAAEQIHAAIRKKKTHAYITRRWRLMAWAMHLVPEALWWRVR